MSPDWAERPNPVPYALLANPQSLNLFSYVSDNPLARMDPDGHDPAGPSPSGGCSNTTIGKCTTEKTEAPAAATTAAQNQGQPAPTNPDGTPQAPPTTDNKGNPIVPGVDGWKEVTPSSTGDRDTKWSPTQPVPADKSKKEGQPSASWDPAGHWDVKTGKKGETVRVLPDGTRVDHNNNPIPMAMIDRIKSITPGPIVKWGTAAVIIYIIIDEGSRLCPPRNLVPVP